MPTSAINSGGISKILSPEMIGEYLSRSAAFGASLAEMGVMHDKGAQR